MEVQVSEKSAVYSLAKTVSWQEKHCTDVVLKPESISFGLDDAGKILLETKASSYYLNHDAFNDVLALCSIPSEFGRNTKTRHPKEFTDLLNCLYRDISATMKSNRLLRDEHGLIVKSENILNNPEIWREI